MNCPNEIADILLQILARGVVSARSAGWSKELELATLEADHVHNLADLVRHLEALMPEIRATLPPISRRHQWMEQVVQEMTAKFIAERQT